MATTIHEHYLINCPYARARQYLQESIEGSMRKGSATALPLKASLPLLKGSIEKNVLVSYGRGQDPLKFDEPWLVHWTPEDGGPYPDFDGALTVRADESYRRAILELRGEYRPPLGTFGQAFDLVLGARIAAGTARGLLNEIGAVMEDQFQAEERFKERAV
jgi:hypothetical protein